MKPNTRRLTESAIMIALAAVLSIFKFVVFPNGGAVTLASMVPIILISFRYDIKWALVTAIAYAGLQMLPVVGGLYPPPVPNFLYYTLTILLDYVIAFGVLGLAGMFGKLFKKPSAQIIGGSSVVIGLRFLCHFLSGIIVWGSNTPPDQPAWLYSLIYNGSYMVPELIITVIVVVLLSQVILKQWMQKTKLQ